VTTTDLRSVLAGTSGLALVFLISVGLTLARPHVSFEANARHKFLGLFAVALGAQCLHFTEELLTGFHERFPALLGFAPWSTTFFVSFNLAWIAVWAISALALRPGFAAALAPLWFLALALLVNGIAHPLLALRAGGYFPGLYTSPLVGVSGALLSARLWRLTEPAERLA
jgi:hypothetical protein